MSQSIFRNGDGAREGLYKLFPHVFNHSKLFLSLIVFHAKDALYLVADRQVLYSIA